MRLSNTPLETANLVLSLILATTVVASSYFSYKTIRLAQRQTELIEAQEFREVRKETMEALALLSEYVKLTKK
ncbi:hypothetical protein [Limnobacter sp.]|uniref:hypothetical protein n=1 Tax=Limnobacter sp. TaxID=2003368 RepID=UPI00391D6CFA